MYILYACKKTMLGKKHSGTIELGYLEYNLQKHFLFGKVRGGEREIRLSFLNCYRGKFCVGSIMSAVSLEVL